jgi:hypothetical protein
VPARLIHLRYSGTCVACAKALSAGSDAWWDGDTKAARCMTCGSSPLLPPTAGGSAQREFERRKIKREDGIRSRHPHLGGLIVALTEEPATTTSWAKGAAGERKVGALIDSLAPAGVFGLHDRRRAGTTANIDHLAVGPTGVWVIDAKRYNGQVGKKDVGGWLSTDVRLFVGRRDCTPLVTAMAKQVDAVRVALGAAWVDVQVRPMLCFVDAEWGLLPRPFDLEGVSVVWPKAARGLLVRPGPLPPTTVALVAAHLDERLKPAR